MSETPPSSSAMLQEDSSTGKRRSEAPADGQNAEASRVINHQSTSNGNVFLGEMERRGEEKLLDESIRERYQKELGDIFDDSTY